MSFISKDHFSMALQGIKRLLNQKVDKSDMSNYLKYQIVDEVPAVQEEGVLYIVQTD